VSARSASGANFQVIGIAPITPHDIRRMGRTFMSVLNVDINIGRKPRAPGNLSS